MRCISCGRQAERGNICNTHRSLPEKEIRLIKEFVAMYGKIPAGNEMKQFIYWRETIKVYG